MPGRFSSVGDPGGGRRGPALPRCFGDSESASYRHSLLSPNCRRSRPGSPGTGAVRLAGESSVWSFRNSPVMLQDLTGAPGAAVRPAEASLSLCHRLSLHCGSLLLTCSGGPGQAAAVLGSAPSVGSRGCRSSFLWLGEEKACYPGFARRGRSISCLNLSVWLPYVLPPFQQLKH